MKPIGGTGGLLSKKGDCGDFVCWEFWEGGEERELGKSWLDIRNWMLEPWARSQGNAGLG